MELVPFPVRPPFRALALVIALLAFWAAGLLVRLVLELAPVEPLFAVGFTFTALALLAVTTVAASIGLAGSLPRALVGPDDDETPTDAV